MGKVNELGYVGISAQDLDSWKEYAVNVLGRYEQELLAFFESRKADVLAELKNKKAIDDGLKAQIVAALEEFKKEFTA